MRAQAEVCCARRTDTPPSRRLERLPRAGARPSRIQYHETSLVSEYLLPPGCKRVSPRKPGTSAPRTRAVEQRCALPVSTAITENNCRQTERLRRLVGRLDRATLDRGKCPGRGGSGVARPHRI